ncbi:PR-1-like protein [Atractiella rhizophila]|nr:PR-1-like protein [Atractiella rhizophila]
MSLPSHLVPKQPRPLVKRFPRLLLAARKPHSKTRRPLRPTSTTISSSELPQPTITSSSKVEEPTSVAKTTTSKEDPPSSSAEAEPTTSREEDPSTTSKSAPTPSAEPEEPSTSSSSTPKSAPTSGSGLSGLSAFAKEALKGHNDFRAQYGAEALSWSDELEAAAQKWTDRCVFEHGGGVALGAGENIAAGQNSISSAIKNWGPDEAADYNPNAVEASHFTQMVWKATTQVGCAVTQCDSLAIFGGGPGALYACEYLTAVR